MELLNKPSGSKLFGVMAATGRSPARLAAAGSAFDATLHRVFDQWIDSGKSGKGRIVDAANERDVFKVPPGYPQSLSEVLRDWWTRNPLRVGLQRTSNVVILYPQEMNLSLVDTAPALAGRDLAVNSFVRVLDLPYRQRLARCANPRCGRYFVYARTPQHPIKNGTFCKRCKHAGSVQRTKASRSHRTDALIKLAADYWPQYSEKKHRMPHAKWIAKKMIETRIGRGISASGKWVTQHQKQIEAEVKRRKHAKS